MHVQTTRYIRSTTGPSKHSAPIICSFVCIQEVGNVSVVVTLRDTFPSFHVRNDARERSSTRRRPTSQAALGDGTRGPDLRCIVVRPCCLTCSTGSPLEPRRDIHKRQNWSSEGHARHSDCYGSSTQQEAEGKKIKIKINTDKVNIQKSCETSTDFPQ